MKEEWKKIEYNPNYEISNLGNVRNTYSGRMMKHVIQSTGLPIVCLSYRGKIKSFSVPKLMIMAFKPELLFGNEKKHIYFKDGNRCNLSLDNLDVSNTQQHIVNKIKENDNRRLYNSILKISQSVISRNERLGIDDKMKTIDEIYSIIKTLYDNKNIRMKRCK